MPKVKLWPKVINLAEKVEKDIISGVYGQTGDRFLSLRKLSASLGVSIVTAQGIMTALKSNGIIMLRGNKNYITAGNISKVSPLSQILKVTTKVKQITNKPLIGIHVTEIGNPFFDSVIKKIVTALEKKGFRSIIMSSSQNSKEERAIINEFIDLGVSGIISCPNYDRSLSFTYNNYILPVVFFGRQLTSCDVESVIVNNIRDSQHVAYHLIDQGYQNFAYIGLKNLPDAAAEDYRRIGFVDALNHSGHCLDDNNIMTIDMNNVPRFTSLFKQFISKSRKPIGIFCYHDLIAVEVLRICNNLGIIVPHDVGVVGFDDLPIASQVNPSLTTIAYRFDQMAQTTADLLVEKMSCDRSDNKGIVIYINTVLKVRKSSFLKEKDDIKSN